MADEKRLFDWQRAIFFVWGISSMVIAASVTLAGWQSKSQIAWLILLIGLPIPLAHAIFGVGFRYIHVRMFRGGPVYRGQKAVIWGSFMALMAGYILWLGFRKLV